MEAPFMKYQPTEVVQIIQANYRQQQQYDDIALKGQELSFDTTVGDWRDICDLVDTTELWKYLNFYFRTKIDRETWLTQLEPEDEKTLGELCNFISAYASKDIIRPLKIFGNKCETAAIFKTFTSKLKDRGIDISGIKPSSKLEPLVQKYRSVIIEEVNLIAPNALPPIDYKTNWVYKWGLRLFIAFVFVTIFFAVKESVWTWWTGAILVIGYLMTRIGSRLNAKRARFEGIDTVADLVRRINTAPNMGFGAMAAERT
jgi:hypothetical protein